MSSTRHYVSLAGLVPADTNSNLQVPGCTLPSFQEFCEGIRSMQHDNLLRTSNEKVRQLPQYREAAVAVSIGMSGLNPTNTSNGHADNTAQTAVAIAPHMPSHQSFVGCVLPVTQDGVASTAEALRHLRQSPEVPEQIRSLLNDPLPGFMRPLACSNTQYIPEPLYQYVEILALNLASDDALLGIWFDMFNIMDIKISFAVLCAICERIVNQAPLSLKLVAGIPLHDQDPLKEAMLQRLISKAIALHQWAISEDGIRVRQTQARLLDDSFDLKCSYRLATSVAIWNGFLVGRGGR